mmetsp:Transcript_95900/g.175684  ORF Transcript_95900/g.175684 Transcript_95900/m.175684 type:complete len:202 (-) Transcript_95900:76-681(-)
MNASLSSGLKPLRSTMKPRSWPFDLASWVSWFFKIGGAAFTNSSKSMTSLSSLSAFFMILSKSLSVVATKPSEVNACRSSSRSKLPLSSLSAASNIRFSTSCPNLLSLVSTKSAITLECCLMTCARIFCNSCAPIASRAPRTIGAKGPVGVTFSSFSTFGFSSVWTCILAAGNRGRCPGCAGLALFGARSNVLSAEISRDC